MEQTQVGTVSDNTPESKLRNKTTVLFNREKEVQTKNFVNKYCEIAKQQLTPEIGKHIYQMDGNCVYSKGISSPKITKNDEITCLIFILFCVYVFHCRNRS